MTIAMARTSCGLIIVNMRLALEREPVSLGKSSCFSKYDRGAFSIEQLWIINIKAALCSSRAA